MTVVEAKKCSRFVTAQMRGNAVENAKRFDWAAGTQKAAVSAAELWANLSDEELWEMVPSNELPWDIHTNKEAGCPNCGQGIQKYGNYPWKIDYWNKPWKIMCPNCGESYPKNDFYAFYKTALDEHGLFRKHLGDRSLLFNADHPDPKDPLHKLYVDDGYGMVDEKGNRHSAIAYYVDWGLWPQIYRGLDALSRAYTLTDDPRYAHKCAVLLDRIADVFPDMYVAKLAELGFQRSYAGPPWYGRIELWTGNYRTKAYAYDHVYDGIRDDSELVRFCSQKAAQCKLADKSSIEKICHHIEDHVLLEILKACKEGDINGNTGYTHMVVTVAAIALDREKTTEEWLNFMFDPDFPGHSRSLKNPIPWVLVEGLDRDGMGGECGGYGLGWTNSMVALPEMLASYPDYTNHKMTAEYPKLKQCFLLWPRMMCLDAAFPNIGDSGATGQWNRIGSAETFVRGYKLFRDPRMAALAAHYAHGNHAQYRLPDDIFAEDPDALAREIAAIAKDEPVKLRCEHTGRYGQAILQTETAEEGRALWVHYGYRKGHSHADNLNIGLYARNMDMLPELGYPEYTGGWPKRHAWTANTISHNTLLVNDQKANHNAGGKIELFTVQPPLRVMDVASSRSYNGLTTYRRTVALVDVSDTDSYVFDVFRARGGKNHRLSYHGPAETATVSGIQLVKQATGTFASPDVEFATLDGELADFYKTSGFTYLYDVERSAGPVDSPFTVDWKAEDLRGRIREGKEPHLRLHSLSSCDEVATAAGDPPQNKAGNPRRLCYMLQSRLGDNVESQFVTVLEPYDTTPFIKQVRTLKVQHDADPNSVAAVAVDLLDGTTDILISCEERAKVKVEGGVEFDGQFGMVRLVNGQGKLMRMSNATLLKSGDVELKTDTPAYEGTVTGIDVSDPMDSKVSLDPPLPQDAGLVGRAIHFRNDIPIDTTYDISALTDAGVSTGDITVVWGFREAGNFDAGYKYLVNVGDKYIVPTSLGLDR